MEGDLLLSKALPLPSCGCELVVWEFLAINRMTAVETTVLKTA
jgi:hypothetical protein